MGEIIKKLEEEVFRNAKLISVSGSLYVSLCDIKKIFRIIGPEEPLTESQIESIRWLKEYKKCCAGCDYENEETDTIPCCMCSRLTDDEYRPKKELSIGDKIRESNKSLADYIYKVQTIPPQPIHDTIEYILDYLNQPFDKNALN